VTLMPEHHGHSTSSLTLELSTDVLDSHRACLLHLTLDAPNDSHDSYECVLNANIARPFRLTRAIIQHDTCPSSILSEYLCVHYSSESTRP